MASKVAVVNLSGSLNAKNRDFARLSSPLGGQTPPRRPYRRIGGILTAMDITFPGFTSFTSPQFAEPINTSDFFIGALNSSGDAALTLDFTTTMTPGSLVGFTGGSIFGLSVLNNTTAASEYSDLSGSITPAPAPEPSSLALIPLGLGALLVLRKRMGHNHPSVV